MMNAIANRMFKYIIGVDSSNSFINGTRLVIVYEKMLMIPRALCLRSTGKSLGSVRLEIYEARRAIVIPNFVRKMRKGILRYIS